MKNNIKVSIIIPVYNVEQYIKQCLDSVINQTLKEIEIICVDDGSKDKCPDIIDKYAKKDSRIVAIHQANAGYGRAVNHGLELAKGEYIGIVESDDFIEPDMYETLYNDAKTHDVDVVKGVYNEYYDKEDGTSKYKIAGISELIQPPLNPFTVYEYPMILEYHPSIWTAIYKTDFIRKNNIKVLEINKGRYADQNWRYETLMLANKIYWEHKPFYNYRLTNINASSFKKNNPDDIFDVYSELNKFLLQHQDKYQKIKENLYSSLYGHMIWNLNRVSKKYYFYCLDRIHNLFKNMDKNVIVNSSKFSSSEKKFFLVLAGDFYKSKIIINNIIDFVFSIKDSKKHKVIRILGIKISIRKKERRKNVK